MAKPVRKKRNPYTEEEVKNFSDNLKRLQEEAGFSNKEVAELIGYNTGYYSNLKSGKAKPPKKFVTTVAELFEINEEVLLQPESKIKEAQNRAYGASLVRARDTLGLKMSDVATMLGITPVSYKSYEFGDSPVPERLKEQLERQLLKPAAKITAAKEPKKEVPAPKKAEEKQTSVTPEKSKDDELYKAIDLVVKHVTDLKVGKELQRTVFRSFSKYLLEKQEERLFG